MIRKYSVEEYRAKLDEIVRCYRLGIAEPDAHEKLTQDQALACLRKLSFTVGEALRLLRPEGRRCK
jgi:hypothetical protein